MKLSQLIKALAIFSVLAVSPVYADCAACDSDNPDSNAETQQEPDETTSTTDDVSLDVNNSKDSYYLKNSSYTSAPDNSTKTTNANSK